MTLPETFKLAHRNFTASRTRSIATIITIGILFSLLLAILLILRGAESVAIRYCLADSDTTSSDTATNNTDQPTSNAITPAPQSTPSNQSYLTPLERLQQYFTSQKCSLRPIIIALLIASILILTFTLAHLISQSTKTFAIYRAVGASKLQILLIFFAYLLELCLYATIFAIILSLVFASIATGLSWDYLSTKLHDAYPASPFFPPVLIGFSWQYLLVILCLFLTSPIAFLLCLDQFSVKKLTLKLKGA